MPLAFFFLREVRARSSLCAGGMNLRQRRARAGGQQGRRGKAGGWGWEGRGGRHPARGARALAPCCPGRQRASAMVVFSAEVVSSGDAGAASRYLPVRVEVDSKELRLRAAGGGAGGGEGEDKGEGEGAQAPAAGELLGAFPREGVVRYCDASRHVVPGPSDCFDVQLEDANGGRRALRLRMPSEDAVSAIVYHMRATDVAGRSLTGSCAPTPKRPGRAPLFELPAEGDWSGRPVAQCADAQTGMTPRRDSARTPRGVPALPKVSAMTQTPTKATEQAGPEATAEVHAEATTPRTERHMQREAALAYIHADYMFAAAAAEATLMALADKQARERASTEAHGLFGANLEASSRWILEGHGRWTKDLHPARAADSGAAPESHPSQSQPRPESAKLVGDRTSMVADVQAQKIALLQQQLEEVKVQQGNMLHARREAQRAHGHKRANEEPPTEQQEHLFDAHRPGITAAPASTAPARHAHAKAEDKPTGLGGKDDPMRSSAGSRLRFSTGNGFADMMEGLEPSSGDGASALAGTAAVAPHSHEKPGRSSWPQRRSLAEKNSSMGVAAVMRSPEVADERVRLRGWCANCFRPCVALLRCHMRPRTLARAHGSVCVVKWRLTLACAMCRMNGKCTRPGWAATR